ncbi:hypothetical protein V8B55DRAFT_1334687 [Mucor lusitanicus]|uniref:PH domain-containing protein n=1 Tax=Mucor lusitanicus CBS 277.49 TaxID=747725 RepID=A0A168GP33_MUCCL|nr:hypothetical protein MUCCIDRAFT_115967 [Mucor lusitanicus CBS 277.49]
MLLKWGWVQQRISFKFRPAVWKKRYLVLTTMSIHVYKSEKGVISSLFQENMPEIHVFSDFQSFKCVTTEEKDKWITAIDEQLQLTSKMWSSQPVVKETEDNGFCRLTKLKQQNPNNNKCKLQNPIVPVSVLDKWLEQLDFMDSPEKQQAAATRNYRRRSNCSEASHSRRGSSHNNRRRSSVQAGAVEKNHDHRHSNGMSKKRMHKIIANY